MRHLTATGLDVLLTEQVAAGKPLLGICAPEKLPLIQKIITRVKADWDSEQGFSA